MNKFLDTNIHVNSHGKVSTTVHRKPFKKPIHWSSRVPKRYKRNSITGELYRAKRISDDVEEEVKKIKDKFCKANYPKRFVESVINEFKKKEERSHEEEDESTLIPRILLRRKETIPVN